MKAVTFVGKRDVRVVEVPTPSAGCDGVVVRVRACGICGTDLHVYNSALFVDVSSTDIAGYPIIGHEFTGEVVEVGPEAAAAGWRVGERVASVHNKGGMAEYACIPGQWLKDLYRLPADLPYSTAVTLEPLCNPVHSFNLRPPRDGETVAIFGAGVIGLGYLQVVKACSGARTVVVDVSPLRLDLARRLGADVTLNARETDPVREIKALTGEHRVRYQTKTAGGCDVVVDCTGRAGALAQALEVAKPAGGAAVLAGIFEDEVPVEINTVLFKHMDVHGSMGYHPAETAEALRLITSGRVRRDLLVTHTFPLEQAAEAFRVQGDASVSVKVILANG